MNILKHPLRLVVEWEIIPLSPAQGIKYARIPAGHVRYVLPTELPSPDFGADRRVSCPLRIRHLQLPF